jgi:predicted RNA-binding protein YlqC (UPF0109 family)
MSKFTESLKRLGDIEVTDWDFAELLHRDIEDLEVTRSLRRLGRMRVTEWEFKDVLPAMNRLAHKEVNLVDIFRRAAAYRVMEWDFKTATTRPHKAGEAPVSDEEIRSLSQCLERFLSFVATGLIEQPGHARITVSEIAPAVLCFRLILVKRDAAILIGHGGHGAAAIRRIMQAIGQAKRVNILLKVMTHEEAAAEELQG